MDGKGPDETTWLSSKQRIQSMSDNSTQTMRQLLEQNDYTVAELTNPCNVQADDIDEDTVVVAYTVVNNPDPDAPATRYELGEWEVEAVVPADELAEWSDGSVSYPENTPVESGVVWSYRSDDMPNVASIGYGDDMYGEETTYDDPHRLDRLSANVRGRSDSWVRFKL
jgi:hypothetical protein